MTARALVWNLLQLHLLPDLKWNSKSFFGWMDLMTNEKQSPFHFSFTTQPAPSFHPATAADCWQCYQRGFCGLLITVVAFIITISVWLLIKAQRYVGITTFHHSCYLIFGISCKCNRINENAFLEIASFVTCRTQRRAPCCKSQIKITSHSPKRNESICKSSLCPLPWQDLTSPAAGYTGNMHRLV